VRRPLAMAFVAMAAVLVAALTAASPASAAGGVAYAASAQAAATSSPVTTFIKAFVDSKSKNNDAAFGNDVFPVSGGGYIVTGAVGVSPYSGWVTRLSAAGTVQWQEQLGSGASNFLSVQQTSDGGFILAGGTSSETKCAANGLPGPLSCAWVVKLSSTGAVQWQDVYPGSQEATADQIGQTSDGGYIVAGSTTASGGDVYAWIAKLTSAGALQWQQQFGSAPFAAASSVEQTSDGGYIIAGSSGAIGSSSVLAAKLSSTGTVQWQQTYGSGYEDSGNSVEQTSDGGYIVGGEVVTENQEGEIPGEALLLKLSSTGAIQFQDVFNADIATNLSSRGAAVKQTPDGGYALAGSEVLLSSGDARVTASWLVKTTSTGALSWQHIFYGPSGFSGFGSVRLTSDGGYIAAGTTSDFADADNFWLVKTDSNGNVTGGTCKDQHAGTTTEQAGGVIATTTTFPIVTPPAIRRRPPPTRPARPAS
jgi:hypothetical protein